MNEQKKAKERLRAFLKAARVGVAMSKISHPGKAMFFIGTVQENGTGQSSTCHFEADDFLKDLETLLK